MITKVEAYKTSDGHIFETENQAVIHESTPEFLAWYNNNKIDNMEISTIMAWLTKHFTTLVNFASLFRARAAQICTHNMTTTQGETQ